MPASTSSAASAEHLDGASGASGSGGCRSGNGSHGDIGPGSGAIGGVGGVAGGPSDVGGPADGGIVDSGSTLVSGLRAVGSSSRGSNYVAIAAPPSMAGALSKPDVSLQPRLLLDTRSFLSQHWGVRPLFLPGLLPGYRSPVSPDDLAGLACEPDVESRIITGRGCCDGSDMSSLSNDSETESPYSLILGPFDESIFESPQCADGTPWTLLVHEVNRHVPAVADVLDLFRVLPNWRVDDVMVSYATEGGGVGPHVDNYDVFLLQVSGKRRWRVSSKPISENEESAALVQGIDIRVLGGGFSADQDHVLSPGDCMYVSPRCPHWGEALDDECMTFSIGFRAPTVADLAIGWAEEVACKAALGAVFLSDVRQDLVENFGDPGRISEAAVDAAYNEVLSAMTGGPNARERFRDWFCQHVSAPKRFREAEAPSDQRMDVEEAHELVSMILAGGSGDAEMVRQQEGTVFAYTVVEGRARVYVDGQIVVSSCSTQLAALLCSRRSTSCDEYASFVRGAGERRVDEDEIRVVLASLLRKDILYVEGKVHSKEMS